MQFLLTILALLGHAYLWAAVFNLTHSLAMPRRILGPSTALAFACALFIPVAFWLGFAPGGAIVVDPHERSVIAWLGRLYLGACWIAAGVTMARWVKRHVFGRTPAVLRHNRSRRLNLAQPSGRLYSAPGDSLGAKDRSRHDSGTVPIPAQRKRDCPPPKIATSDHHFVARLPGNQILQLEVAERALEVPRLTAALDHLTIVHLSDLHFTGRIGKAYFDEVVRLNNRVEPDLVAITGDLVDKPKCIDWIPETLGKLTSRYGAYFVLGNHDLRLDAARIRQTLLRCGLVDLGARWTEIRIRGEPVILAGNGLPWLAPAADLAGAPPPSSGGGPLRIALAHSPDQFGWARARAVDLLLAGHTHGRQLSLPLVGPILSATRLGAAYSAGVFYVPPTILHVTRGVSAQIPVRIHCPSEMAKLVLRAPL